MLTLVKYILGERKGKIYLATLELGMATVAQISKKADLPRSTCYLFLEVLKEKGLVSQIKKGKKTLVSAEPPEKILSFAQKQKENLDQYLNILKQNLPELKALNNRQPRKPAVRFYEGFAGIKTILEDSLEAKEILVLCSGYKKSIEKKLSLYLDKYFVQVDKRGIKTFEILGSAPDRQDYLQKYQSKLHRIKKLAETKCQTPTTNVSHIDKLIFGHKLALVSFEFLNGVVLENEPIVDFEKKLFWRLWKN